MMFSAGSKLAPSGTLHDDLRRPRGPCRSSRWCRRRPTSVMPRGAKAPKLCPAEPREVDRDRVLGQARLAVRARHLGAEDRADGAVRVADRQVRARPSRRARARAAPARAAARRAPGRARARCGSRSAGSRAARPACRGAPRSRGPSPSSASSRGRQSSRSDAADHLVDRAEAELRHDLAHLLGDEEQVLHDVLGLPREALAQLRVLRRDADRTRVQVADAHQDAAHRDERRGREAELVGAEQRGDRDVAAGLESAVGLHADAAAQVVHAPASAASRRARSPRAGPRT